MKKTTRVQLIFAGAILAFFALLFLRTVAHGQQTPAPVPASTSLVTTQPPAIVTTVETVATPFIVSFAQGHPWLATVLTIMAAIGSVAKPIVTAVEIYVRNSPSESAEVTKVEASFGYKVVAWLLDFFTRIKIGPQFTATPKS